FEVSVEGRPAGEHILAEQVELPAGVELVADPELLVVNISEELEMDTESDADETTEDEAADEESTDEAASEDEASEEE
ncbi:50S ribosomal protein L25, partial [Mycobacterium tuberculosis]|nr:50S ribosomal protein L25 [Mycobacterium tuberculosis]